MRCCFGPRQLADRAFLVIDEIILIVGGIEMMSFLPFLKCLQVEYREGYPVSREIEVDAFLLAG